MEMIALGLRSSLGLLLLVAGGAKVSARDRFAQAVGAYSLLPRHAIPAVARWLPLLEIAAGALLLTGRATTVAALAAAAMLAVRTTRAEGMDRRGFRRRIALKLGAGVGLVALGRTGALAADDSGAACTCCVDCQACNCGGCGFGKARYRCVRAGCSTCTGCRTAGGCFQVANCC